MSAFRRLSIPAPETARWLWLACRIAAATCGTTRLGGAAAAALRIAREAGALTVLPIALRVPGRRPRPCGELAAAAALVEEVDGDRGGDGTARFTYARDRSPAGAAEDAEAVKVIERAVQAATASGRGHG